MQIFHVYLECLQSAYTTYILQLKGVFLSFNGGKKQTNKTEELYKYKAKLQPTKL